MNWWQNSFETRTPKEIITTNSAGCLLSFLLINVGSSSLFNSQIFMTNNMFSHIRDEKTDSEKLGTPDEFTSAVTAKFKIGVKVGWDEFRVPYCTPMHSKVSYPILSNIILFHLLVYIKWGNTPHEHSLKAILRRCKHVPSQGTWLGQKRLQQVSPSLTSQTLEIWLLPLFFEEYHLLNFCDSFPRL